jgi:DUF4097 and DUF4098 domain-containing protein YvlB
MGVALLAGCNLAHAEVKETTRHQAEAAALLAVESDGGSVELRPGAAGVIKVEATRKAATRDEALALPVTVEKRGDRVVVAFHQERRSNASVSFVIEAPPTTKLEVKTGGGSIRVDGLSSGVAIRTGGGSVSLHSLRGALRIETGGGSIDVRDVDGTVAAQTGGGSIHVSGAHLSGDNSLSTGGGSIDCALGADARLKVNASTGGGRARNDFGLAGDGRHFSGAIGDGGAGSLQMSTGGGSISLNKG